uniref:Ig-like domain-containing protein n=1 Tax=Amphiprion percula TaxID=161767 RepID=A0A3P8SCB1_AMPPE
HDHTCSGLENVKLYSSCAAGLAVVVLQSGEQIHHPHHGDSITLECGLGQGFSMSSYTMLWYRQNHHGAQIEFLTKEYDKPLGRFQSSINTAENKFPLQISELVVNDSSIYYCAASHSDALRAHT